MKVIHDIKTPILSIKQIMNSIEINDQSVVKKDPNKMFASLLDQPKSTTDEPNEISLEE